ncbi:tetratricopeptide repeat protein [Flavobacterium sp. PL12]|uniref:tetratricopeptide repeat protein n=1 Tax=Flavobacterium sp. PL12 TaxID=3071718 RepID=UPI00319E6C2C
MNEENYILFDQYLQNELTAVEKDNFEKLLQEDQEVASNFETFKNVHAQLENKFTLEEERNAFTENLKAIAQQNSNLKDKKAVNFKPVFYLVAASVLLLVGLFLFDANSKPNFEDFNQFDEAHFIERGEQSDYLKQAEDAFNAKNYVEAIPLFELILNENKTAEIQYYYGVSLLENNKIKEAEVAFLALQSGNSIYKNKATYGLALAKLKQEEYKSCKEILLTIPSDYENYDAVQKLLKELN